MWGWRSPKSTWRSPKSGVADSPPGWLPALEKELDEVLRDFSRKVAETLREYERDPYGKLLKKKNPFLFRIRGYTKPEDFAKALVEAGASSSEETKFGNLFEECAILYCKHGKGGRKSATEGIDIEFHTDREHFLIQQKSGESWGNSRQVKALEGQFKAAAKRLRQSATSRNAVCIEGISYGAAKAEDKVTYHRLVGPVFWEKISGWSGAYLHLSQKVGQHSGNGLRAGRRRAVKAVVSFLEANNCVRGGEIDWDRLTDLLAEPKRPAGG